MDRYQKIFNKLKLKKEKCFVPFVVIGDPSEDTSLDIINTLILNGADGLELGIPFSDPMADGPIIQNANLRALSSKITLLKCFKIIKNIRKKNPFLPIGLLVYANLIWNHNVQKFYSDCSKSGVDSILIADVPIEESHDFRNMAKQYNIAQIFICPPNADKHTVKKILKLNKKGYIYLLSRGGVTGIKNNLGSSLAYLSNTLHRNNSVPLLQGFGISTPFHIKQAILNGADGVICGSVIIQIIEKNYFNHTNMIKNLASLVRNLKIATT